MPPCTVRCHARIVFSAKGVTQGGRACAWDLQRVGRVPITPPLWPAPLRQCVRRRYGNRLPHAPGQVGIPATVNAGASMGSSRMAHRSAAAAINGCVAEKFALIRFVGTASRAQSAPRTATAQRAEVGCRACCALGTHVANPPIHGSGELNPSGARGLAVGNSLAVGSPASGCVSICSRLRLVVETTGLGAPIVEYVRTGAPYPHAPFRESPACV